MNKVISKHEEISITEKMDRKDQISWIENLEGQEFIGRDKKDNSKSLTIEIKKI